MNIALANPTEMIQRGAPRVIHSDEELEEYTRALFQLTAKRKLTSVDEEAIELLTVLIDRYESTHYAIPEADPAEVLRFLLEHNGLSQRDVAADLGGESVVSLILGGKRQMNRDHIARLSHRFQVSPAAFFGPSSSNRADAIPNGNASYFVEQQSGGGYAIRKPTSRATTLRRTQAEAIQAAKHTKVTTPSSSPGNRSRGSRTRASAIDSQEKAFTK
jgi:HTH-type transcriptional regulator/antitoxin HigA